MDHHQWCSDNALQPWTLHHKQNFSLQTSTNKTQTIPKELREHLKSHSKLERKVNEFPCYRGEGKVYFHNMPPPKKVSGYATPCLIVIPKRANSVGYGSDNALFLSFRGVSYILIRPKSKYKVHMEADRVLPPGASGRVLTPATGRSRVRVAVSSHCTGEGKTRHWHPSPDPAQSGSSLHWVRPFFLWRQIELTLGP